MKKFDAIALTLLAPCFAQHPPAAPPAPPAARFQGEFLPYQSVDLVARVAGFVESISVDRGSVVKQGEVLAKLSAPELAAQKAEAETKVEAILAQRAELEAKLAAAQSSAEKMREAAKTPGVIAANEVVLADKAVDAVKAQVAALEKSAAAARSHVQSIAELQSFLTIGAPFDATVTARYMHPGALAGPTAGPLLRLEQVSRLRLVVSIPEGEVAKVRPGTRLSYTVNGAHATATVARVSRSLDFKTRTMAVEADVTNNGKLAPGMYAEVTFSK
jgi:RND family efflux transporter MFP subunit